MIKLLLAIWVGKFIYFLTRTIKFGGGSAAPGYYALKIEPKLVELLSKQIPQNIAITGTNGKTTTARILNHLVKSQGLKTLRNSTGSNLERGIASALIKKTSLFGDIRGIDLGIWELDEAAFNKTVFQIKPQIMVFLNAFRDQLDRYGEVDTVVNKWKDALLKISWNPKVVINGNDPNTLSLAGIKGLNDCLFIIKGHHSFGETSGKKLGKEVKGDIETRITKLRGLEGTDISVKFPTGEEVQLKFNTPGVYHVYDLVAASGVYYHLNLPIKQINSHLSDFTPAFGRVEKVNISGKDGFIFLIKNPAGATLVFETLEPEIKKDDRILMALNDNFADGKDVSWIWDAGFEQLGLSGKNAEVVVSGTRAQDLAVRLKYAELSSDNIEVKNSLEEALNSAVSNLKGRLFILPTYTALLELQNILAKRGHKAHYWKEES
jgi:lipid II isoglutaminyl synthase (glutamine-hydrolysing)